MTGNVWFRTRVRNTHLSVTQYAHVPDTIY
jgi:hypothetical protein